MKRVKEQFYMHRVEILLQQFLSALSGMYRLTLRDVIFCIFDLLVYINFRIPASNFIYHIIENPLLAFFLVLMVSYHIIKVRKIFFNRYIKDGPYKEILSLELSYLVTCF
jgi:hypothetical protein